MMTNLFDIFDPTSLCKISLSWLSLLFGLLFTVNSSFLIISRLMMSKLNLTIKIMSEIMNVTKNKKTSIMFIAFFMFIMLLNILGLTPYVFAPTSHMTITLSVALPMWASLMFLGWGFNTNHMFTHLLPSGTPGFLMIFMVLIETVSNLMRPITLSLRLMANMTAGHIMMSLLNSMIYSSSTKIFIMLFFLQLMLLTLEIAVAMIQSYVLMILSALYSSEV